MLHHWTISHFVSSPKYQVLINTGDSRNRVLGSLGMLGNGLKNEFGEKEKDKRVRVREKVECGVKS